MRVYYLYAVIALLIASCNTRKEDRARNDNLSTEVITADRQDNIRTHEGTYQGVYKGDLPTASGSGMVVTLNLSDGKYVKTIQYNDDQQKETYKSEGNYTWDRQSNKIRLEGEEAPNTYQIDGDRLYHLDINDNRITGEMENNYILRKQ